MEFKLAHNAPGFLRFKHFKQSGRGMGVQIFQDHPNHLRFWESVLLSACERRSASGLSRRVPFFLHGAQIDDVYLGHFLLPGFLEKFLTQIRIGKALGFSLMQLGAVGR